MKKEVLMFVFDGFADWECAYICPELNARDTGYAIRTVAVDKEPKTSMGGLRVLPDYALEECPESFALLLLPGGDTWLGHDNDVVLPLVERTAAAGIPVAAICNGSNFLAEHGYLDQVRHTGNTLEYMQAKAPHYQGGKWFQERQAVCDANIITANGSAALEFAREILLCIGVKTAGEAEAWYRLYRDGFYPA